MATSYATLMPSTLTASPGIQRLIREELPPTVAESLPQIDPLFSQIMKTSESVMDQGIGRGWQVLKIFNTSIGGAINWIPPDWNSVELGKSGDPSYAVYASTPFTTANFPTYPGVAQAPNSGTVMRTLSMARANGNMFLPSDLIKANKLSATQVDYVDKQIQSTAKNVAMNQAISLHDPGISGTSYGVLGRISAIDGTLDGTHGVIKVTLASGFGRIGYILPGMTVAIHANNAGVPNAALIRNSGTGPLLVDAVDPYNRTVRLVDPQGEAVNGIGIAADDFLLIWGNTTAATIYKGPFGFADWMKTSGTLFDANSGISLTYFPQFSSYTAAVGDVLTEIELNKRIGVFEEACDVDLDTVITTMGVTIKYLEQPHSGAGRQSYDRQGQALNYQTGFVGVGYAYEGKKYNWYTSRFAPTGMMRIVKLGGGNIKRYVPPPLPGVGRRGEFPQEVEFVAPAMGFNGIFAPTSVSSMIRMVQAPFDMLYQIAPEEVRGIVLTTITEAW